MLLNKNNLEGKITYKVEEHEKLKMPEAKNILVMINKKIRIRIKSFHNLLTKHKYLI